MPLHSRSDEEPLVPCSRNSAGCTGSTVPASTGALLDAGVEERQFVRNVAPRVDERSGADLSPGNHFSFTANASLTFPVPVCNEGWTTFLSLI